MSYNVLGTNQATTLFRRAITREGARALREEVSNMPSWNSPEAVEMRLLLDRAKVYRDDKSALYDARSEFPAETLRGMTPKDFIASLEALAEEAISQGNLRKAQTCLRAIVVTTYSLNDYRDGEVPLPVSTFVPMERMSS